MDSDSALEASVAADSPPPTSILVAARNIGPELWIHIGATLARGIGGFLVGTILGVGLGALVQYSKLARVFWEPALDASRPVPAIALLPFLILIFGFSEIGRAVLIVLSILVFTSLAMIEALASVPEAWIRFGRVCGMSRARIFTQVLLPGTLPWLVGPFRLALALSYTLAIAAEFMGAQQGLGFLINTARVNLATPTIWLAILLIGVICQLTDMILVWIFRQTTMWYQGSDSH
jgi:ABC-type nitrate/sulfonate/bicarbonate transport system permease component